jgi:hypothetical protein
MSSLLVDLCANVEQNIDTLTQAENLFANTYPDSPDTIVSVIDLGGLPPELYSPIRQKTYEFKIRTPKYVDGEELGTKIMDLYHAKNNYQIGSFFILSSYCFTELNYLYEDSKNRKEFSLSIIFDYKK